MRPRTRINMRKMLLRLIPRQRLEDIANTSSAWLADRETLTAAALSRWNKEPDNVGYEVFREMKEIVRIAGYEEHKT